MLSASQRSYEPVLNPGQPLADSVPSGELLARLEAAIARLRDPQLTLNVGDDGERA